MPQASARDAGEPAKDSHKPAGAHAPEPIHFRAAQAADARGIYALVLESGLDRNSPYAYLMVGQYFGDTAVVAECDGEVVGFVAAFRVPARLDTVFVWQVAVAQSQRGKGLGSRLLQFVLQREACAEVHYLEATVTPSNRASDALFRGLARKLGTQCAVTECFPAAWFPGESHEAELAYRIGPF